MTEAEVVVALRAAGCVFAEEEARLLVTTAASYDELDAMVTRRVSGLPLEHVVGFVDFCGLRMQVAPGVFVPRRRTELIVEQAIDLMLGGAPGAGPRHGGRRSVVLDMCCGSGAVGASVASMLLAQHIDVELYAVDVDPAAVRCAGANLTPVGGVALQGDLYCALPASLHGMVDLLVANAPYVPTDAIALMPPEARLHEPRIALDGGADGLDVQRRVIGAAPRWLSSRGWLLLETSTAQAAGTMAAVGRAGLRGRIVHDEQRDATVVIGNRGS